MPYYGIFNLGIGIFFLLIIPFMLKIAKENWDAKEYDGVYSILFGIGIALLIGLYFMFNALTIYIHSLTISSASLRFQFVQRSLYLAGLMPYPIGSILLFALPVFIITMGVYAGAIKYFEKRGLVKSGRFQRTVNKTDLELSRKLFHIGLICVLVCYLGVGKMICTSIYTYYSDIFNFAHFSGNFIPYYDFNLEAYQPFMGQTLALFACFLVFGFLLFADFIRIKLPKYFIFLRGISQQWRDTELHTFGPQVYMALGAVFCVLFFTPPIAAVALVIAGLGDGMATIIGITRGRRKLRKGSKKTWEGAIAGIITSFIFGFLIYLVMISLAGKYGAFYSGSIGEGLIVCLGGTLTFFLIDYSTPPISDNILNPVLCGVVMALLSYIIP
ncbi:MAG: diacylglycerol/polyprenol kinase family protein [Candidatus Helarchaeota archaeon]